MSEERKLLKRVKILLECSYYDDIGLLTRKAPEIVADIENLLSQEPETKRMWYQKGYEQGKKDAQPSILDDKYKDEMIK